jgi:transglutaminase-like putative cysteine protease
MNPRPREIETLLLTAFSAVPLYATQAAGIIPLALFHAALALMILRVAKGRSAEIIPEPAMRFLAMAYVIFYPVDAALISRSAIAASTHLVLFIAVYQAIDAIRHANHGQRLLVTALIFTASIATSTDITVLLFVIAFGFVMFRQMMYVSHVETARSIGREYADAPSSRAAAFYLAGTSVLAALLFPVVPRVRNPIVRGIAGTLTNATTGLSTTIDFNHERSSIPDPTVVARIWMGQEAVPFFTPVRLRGAVYDHFHRNQWTQSVGESRDVPSRSGMYAIARPSGFTRSATVQQRLVRGRIFIPTGTFAISGLTNLHTGPMRDQLSTYLPPPRDVVTFDIGLARNVRPLRPQQPRVLDYPVTPEVAALAQRVAGNAAGPGGKAAAVEQYLLRNYRYLVHPEQIGHPMTVDEFLLREKRGHCEYFAAGMVALMSAEGVPARIVGGYYGGRLNPLTGYFVVRNEDAHAWVEVWDGAKWATYDPTPASLRPGNAQGGLLSTYAAALSDSVNYFWDRYVLTYGLADQIALAAEVISRVRDTFNSIHLPRRVPPSAFAVILFTALLIAAITRRRRTLFDDLASHLRRLGIAVGPAMTMEEALQRLRTDHPDAARDLEPVIALYDAERFSNHRDSKRPALIRRKLKLGVTSGNSTLRLPQS